MIPMGSEKNRQFLLSTFQISALSQVDCISINWVLLKVPAGFSEARSIITLSKELFFVISNIFLLSSIPTVRLFYDDTNEK